MYQKQIPLPGTDGRLDIIVEGQSNQKARFAVRWTRFADYWFEGTVQDDGCLDLPDILHLCGADDIEVLRTALAAVYVGARHVLITDWLDPQAEAKSLVDGLRERGQLEKQVEGWRKGGFGSLVEDMFDKCWSEDETLAIARAVVEACGLTMVAGGNPFIPWWAR